MGIPKTAGAVVDFFARNPRVGLAGTIASIIGIPLALLLFLVTQKDRDIRYAMSSLPTTIVRSGQTSDLRVYFKGTELTSTVSSIQVVIWSAGRETVKRENILSKRIALRFQPPTKILEARVKKVTRTLTNFKIDTSDSSSGIIYCSWDVLERGDGALLDVFFLGTYGELISDGAIEGRVPITPAYLRGQTADIQVGRYYLHIVIAILIGLLLGTGVYFKARSVASRWATRPPTPPPSAYISGVFFAIWGAPSVANQKFVE